MKSTKFRFYAFNTLLLGILFVSAYTLMSCSDDPLDTDTPSLKPKVEITKEISYSVPFALPAKAINGTIDLIGDLYPNVDSALKSIDKTLSISNIDSVHLVGVELTTTDTKPEANFDSLDYAFVLVQAPSQKNLTYLVNPSNEPVADGRKTMTASYSENTLSGGKYNFWSNPPENLKAYVSSSRLSFTISLKTLGNATVNKPDMTVNAKLTFKVKLIKQESSVI